MAIRSIPKPVIVALLALGLCGLITVLAAPRIGSYLRTESERLVSEARATETSDPRKAAVRYQMAAFLRPGDNTILKSLADMYVRLDQPDSAIAVLRRLPITEQGSAIVDLQFRSRQYEAALKTINELINEKITSAVLISKSRVLLELDRGAEACTATKDALTYEPDNLQAKEHLAYCQLVVADEAGYQATISSLGSSEAAGTIKTAHVYKLALARELYAQGLLSTSERVLNGLDDAVTERYVLMARIQIAYHNQAEAKELLVRATKLDPASVDARKLLQEVLLKQGDEVAADEQAKLIKALQTGSL